MTDVKTFNIPLFARRLGQSLDVIEDDSDQDQYRCFNWEIGTDFIDINGGTYSASELRELADMLDQTQVKEDVCRNAVQVSDRDLKVGRHQRFMRIHGRFPNPDEPEF